MRRWGLPLPLGARFGVGTSDLESGLASPAMAAAPNGSGLSSAALAGGSSARRSPATPKLLRARWPVARWRCCGPAAWRTRRAGVPPQLPSGRYPHPGLVSRIVTRPRPSRSRVAASTAAAPRPGPSPSSQIVTVFVVVRTPPAVRGLAYLALGLIDGLADVRIQRGIVADDSAVGELTIVVAGDTNDSAATQVLATCGLWLTQYASRVSVPRPTTALSVRASTGQRDRRRPATRPAVDF